MYKTSDDVCRMKVSRRLRNADEPRLSHVKTNKSHPREPSVCVDRTVLSALNPVDHVIYSPALFFPVSTAHVPRELHDGGL